LIVTSPVMRHLLLCSLVFCLIAARTIDNEDNEVALARKAADILASIRSLRKEEKKVLETLEDSERATVEERLDELEMQKRTKIRL
ncbi:hypothetical protein PENTCL1PPCAC_9025, partial [Pristionchus entomophagus]